METHERLRRLPWDGPEGKPSYVTPGDGVINQIADSTEEQVSRRRESHPPPLAEPCGSLSAYTAPIVQPSG
ncbi:hypothetical protein ACFWOI_40175, partial [Streptomyces sp. NPDC058424]